MESDPTVPTGGPPESVTVPLHVPADFVNGGDLTTLESITVTSESPLVDPYAVAVATTVDARSVAGVSPSRAAVRALRQSPGVAYDTDVAESELRPSVLGGQSSEHRTLLNGVDATAMLSPASRLILPASAAVEVSTASAGAPTEYGRAIGGTTEIEVSSGTNQLHGSLELDRRDAAWTHDGLGTEPPVGAGDGGTRHAPESSHTGHELAAGGPFRPDRAWFFVDHAESSSGEWDRGRVGLDGPPELLDVGVDFESALIDLGGQLGPSNAVEVLAIRTDSRGVGPTTDAIGLLPATRRAASHELVALHWSDVIASNLFTDARLSDQRSRDVTLFTAAAGSDRDLGAALEHRRAERRQASFLATLFVGTGELRTGVDGQRVRVGPTGSSGPARGRPSELRDLALFASHRLEGGRLGVTLGLRGEGTALDNDADRRVVEATDLAPRLTAVFDTLGDGRALLRLTAGRFYQQPDGELVRALGEGPPGTGTTAAGVRTGSLWPLVDRGLIEPRIEPTAKDEATLGFEWQLASSWAATARAIWWRIDDALGATIQVDPQGQPFVLVANARDLKSLLRPLGRAEGGVLDGFEPDARRYRAAQLELRRRLHAGWELTTSLTLARLESTAGGRFTLDRALDANAYGDRLDVLLTEGDIERCAERQTPDRPFVDCDAALRPFLGAPLSTVNRKGRDPLLDRPVLWNASGSKTWRLGNADLTIAGLVRVESGRAWARFEALPGSAAAEPDRLPVMLEPSGSRRLPLRRSLDLVGRWGFPLRSGWRGELRLEVLNVTDQRTTLVVDGTGRAPTSRRARQQPRALRLAAGIRF